MNPTTFVRVHGSNAFHTLSQISLPTWGLRHGQEMDAKVTLSLYAEEFHAFKTFKNLAFINQDPGFG